MSKPGASPEYVAYLRSDVWQGKREMVLEQARHRCQTCNAHGSLDVHHRTYERLGHERLDDLIALCRACHDRFHDKREPQPREPEEKRRAVAPLGPRGLICEFIHPRNATLAALLTEAFMHIDKDDALVVHFPPNYVFSLKKAQQQQDLLEEACFDVIGVRPTGVVWLLDRA